jgi:YbbR domain-containing protein
MRRSLFLVQSLVTKNLRLKLTSVLLATLLWAAINAEPHSVVVFKVPLQYRNYPKGVEVMGDTTNSVDVRLTASSRVVRRLDPSDITVLVDLSEWSLGEHVYTLTEQNVQVPYGVRIARITPNKVTLTFERIGEKRVPVRARIVGEAAKGFKVEAVTCTPSAVEVTGPQGRIRPIEFVSTENIDVTGQSGLLRAKVHANLEDPLVQLLKNEEILVEVTIAPLDSLLN